MDNLLDMEDQFREKVFLDEIERLKSEVTRLKLALKEAGVDEDALSDITDEEIICIQQISRLKDYSIDRELDTDEVKRFDVLHKNLKLIRGNRSSIKGDRVKGMTTEELIKQLKV